jgi:hypothetical protein
VLLGMTKTHRLKPAPLEPVHICRPEYTDCGLFSECFAYTGEP